MEKRRLWHNYFIPSLIAAIATATVAYVFEKTLSGVILFASLGASAFILTNSKPEQLTSLKTTIIAYTIAVLISMLVYPLGSIFNITLSIQIFLLVFLVGIFLYTFNAIHPPAISGSLAFILFERTPTELFYLFLSIILLLTLVRIMTYLYHEHLEITGLIEELKR